MLVSVIYPLPLESTEVWEKFKPDVERFCSTWNQFPPGIRCQLRVMCCGNDPSPEVTALFKGMYPTFERYDGGGADLGAQQQAALSAPQNTFQVNFTSRMYFHRAGWLKPLVAARNMYGPLLYGMSHSTEGTENGPYVCTRGHCYDTDDFALYPETIDSKEEGFYFECVKMTRWFESIGRAASVVTWDSTLPYIIGPKAVENGFRDGDQSQMLVWDRHTKIYADADDTEKKRLRTLAYPDTLSLKSSV